MGKKIEYYNNLLGCCICIGQKRINNDLKQTLDSDWANDNDSSLSTKLP